MDVSGFSLACVGNHNHLDISRKVILFFGGGEFGLGKERTSQILQAFIQKVPDYQIVAVARKK